MSSSTKTVKGAEATIEFKKDKVLKSRNSKKYRHEKLDNRLISERTENEARIIKKGSTLDISPKLLNKSSSTLEIEKIEGDTLKNVISENKEVLKKVGEKIGLLHQKNIIHGDLTTNNIIVERDSKEPYLIDFGLSEHSQRIEDKAIDIHLFKQVLKTTHSPVFEESWETIIETYKENFDEAKRTLNRLEEVEKRGRYK